MLNKPVKGANLKLALQQNNKKFKDFYNLHSLQRRYVTVILVIVFIFILLIVRIFYLQIISPDYQVHHISAGDSLIIISRRNAVTPTTKVLPSLFPIVLINSSGLKVPSSLQKESAERILLSPTLKYSIKSAKSLRVGKSTMSGHLFVELRYVADNE